MQSQVKHAHSHGPHQVPALPILYWNAPTRPSATFTRGHKEQREPSRAHTVGYSSRLRGSTQRVDHGSRGLSDRVLLFSPSWPRTDNQVVSVHARLKMQSPSNYF